MPMNKSSFSPLWLLAGMPPILWTEQRGKDFITRVQKAKIHYELYTENIKNSRLPLPLLP